MKLPVHFFFCALFFLGFGCTSTPAITNTETEEIVSDVVEMELNEDLMSIIDMHTHIYPTTKEENEEYIDELVETGLKNGVSKIVVGLHARHEPERPPTYSSEHDEWVLEAAGRYPDVIIPALNGFDPADPEAVDYVREQLETGMWKMIGELDLRNKPKKTTTPANTEILMAIYALAAQFEVPVMFHYDFDYGTDAISGKAELVDALDQNPDTIFIFGHTCGSDVAKLMQTYQNLYCEQEFTTVPSGIDMSRVVLGTDMQVHGQRPQDVSSDYAKLIARVRDAISGWSVEDQEEAAYVTSTKLLGL